MEEKVNVWKVNLTNGAILGLIGIVYSLVMYFMNLFLNNAQGYAFILIQIVVLYFLVKSYRDHFMHRMITFGQALGAGVVICLYYSIIMAIFMYILYAFIDTNLIDKMLAMAEEKLLDRGLSQSQIDAGMSVQSKIMKPGFIAPMSIFGNMFQGLIMSLIVAAFVRKEGNPLIDASESNLN